MRINVRLQRSGAAPTQPEPYSTAADAFRSRAAQLFAAGGGHPPPVPRPAARARPGVGGTAAEVRLQPVIMLLII